MLQNQSASFITNNQALIIKTWESEVRERVSSAKSTAQAVLVDTLSAFLQDLAEAVEKNDPTKLALIGSTLAGDHGGERARLTKYSPEAIIDEYRILRNVIYKLLEENDILDHESKKIIFDSIEEVTMLSVKGYFETFAAVKEQFTLTLTHDLRNPLNTSKMAAEMILRNLNNPEKIEEYSTMILSSTHRIDQMIQTLLDASRLRVGEKINLKIAGLDLIDLLEKVLDDLRLSQGPRFKVIGPDKVPGKWDKDALERVFENLLTNAIKYGDSSKDITISVEVDFSQALIKIHNHGSFIPLSERDKLFSLFKQVKSKSDRNQKGWGVGLLMVKGVMEAHGGSVTVESDPENGTIFILTLPLDYYEGTKQLNT